MQDCKIIKLKKTVLEDNNADADVLRQELKKDKTFYLNIMSSPGSGKTTTILATLEELQNLFKMAVLEADIDSDVDAKTIISKGFDSIQLHTGGMCHLDAEMSRQALREIDSKEYDLIILENVGNLVCPAEFDTGAVKNVVILSVPEGDDKPLKYPLMFELCDVVLVNKIDSMPAFDFDMEKFQENVRLRNPDAKIFPVSAERKEGINAWCEWLENQVREWQK